MLNDLLPQWNGKDPVSAKVSLTAPTGWKIIGNEITDSANAFEVKNIEKAVFLVGKNLRQQTIKVDKTELNLATMGEWQFSDDEALRAARSILKEYRRIFGKIPVQKSRIYLLPFPQQPNQPNRWRPETRGANVLVISGIRPLREEALQRL